MVLDSLFSDPTVTLNRHASPAPDGIFLSGKIALSSKGETLLPDSTESI
jgi:hypothetical protein